jgi:FkbM family methyltransferase
MAHPNHNHEAHKRWNDVRGDDTHRLNYPSLNHNSLVFDIGGYEGNWAQSIWDKYKCNIFIFEPVTQYYNSIKNKFQSNTKISVYDFGLGALTKSCFMSADGDGSSYKSEGDVVKIESITNFISDGRYHNIDLMKINIEGEEYSLLESMIDKNMLGVIDNLQVQFHPWEPNYEERHTAILSALKETHDISYSYPFIWEGFKRKPILIGSTGDMGITSTK